MNTVRIPIGAFAHAECNVNLRSFEIEGQEVAEAHSRTGRKKLT
jgi:hypothetical protein